MLFRVREVKAGYSAVAILNDVSLKVDKGEWVVVLGGNGSGKTTLFKTISGLIKPNSGNIFLDDCELTAMHPHEIVNMGLIHVPEGRMIFPKMSVYDNLLLGGRNKRAKVHITSNFEKIYQLFPILKNRSDQKGGTLSGGEQQMLAISRGLMAEPRLLLLDEPSLGLAPLIVIEIFRSLGKLNNDGLPLLVVEQNVIVSLKSSKRAYILENGRIVISGNSQDLIENERTKRAYLGV